MLGPMQSFMISEAMRQDPELDNIKHENKSWYQQTDRCKIGEDCLQTNTVTIRCDRTVTKTNKQKVTKTR